MSVQVENSCNSSGFVPPDFTELQKVILINRHQREIAARLIRIRQERPEDNSPQELFSVWIVAGNQYLRQSPDVPADKVHLACWQIAKFLIAIRGLSVPY